MEDSHIEILVIDLLLFFCRQCWKLEVCESSDPYHTECPAHPDHAILPAGTREDVHHHDGSGLLRILQDGDMSTDHILPGEICPKVGGPSVRGSSGELERHPQDVCACYRVYDPEQPSIRRCV